jgi:8-oxo-dGTP pyrophosphatase MutT (NUDIX family)
LPKGTQVEGETLIETALREIKEETGVEVKEVCQLGNQYSTYIKYDSIIPKKTHYYLMRYTGGKIRISDGEHNEIYWKPIDIAIELLDRTDIGFEEEATIVMKAKELLTS